MMMMTTMMLMMMMMIFAYNELFLIYKQNRGLVFQTRTLIQLLVGLKEQLPTLE